MLAAPRRKVAEYSFHSRTSLELLPQSVPAPRASVGSPTCRAQRLHSARQRWRFPRLAVVSVPVGKNSCAAATQSGQGRGADPTAA